MGAGPKTTTTSSNTTNPWEPAQAGLKDILGKAKQYGNEADRFAPEQGQYTLNGIDQLGRLGQGPSFGGQAIRGAVGQALDGSQVGIDGLRQLAGGAYINNNRYLDPVLAQARQDTANDVNAQFSAAGRYGSGAHTGALTRQLGNLTNQAMLQNYQTERGAQNQAMSQLAGYGLNAASLAGQADAQDAAKIGYGLQAGSLQDQAAMARKQAPLQAAEWQARLTNPIAGMGGTSNGTQTSQTKQDPMQTALGLGLGAAAMFASGGTFPGVGAGMGSFMGLGGGGEQLPWRPVQNPRWA